RRPGRGPLRPVQRPRLRRKGLLRHGADAARAAGYAKLISFLPTAWGGGLRSGGGGDANVSRRVTSFVSSPSGGDLPPHRYATGRKGSPRARVGSGGPAGPTTAGQHKARGPSRMRTVII